jgi:hypothetical protein
MTAPVAYNLSILKLSETAIKKRIPEKLYALLVYQDF